jgi:hypothetical protein
MASEIKMFFHCRQCMEEMPKGESPETWARLSVGLTEGGRTVQVWCVRHDKNITKVPVDRGH